MHRPPAATWRVMSAGLLLRISVVAAASLCAVTLLAGYFMQGWGATALCLLLLLVICTLAAFRGLGRMPSGQLRWDGELWHWADGQHHAVNALVCVLDLQSCMLLRIQCEKRQGLWLWLESHGQGAAQWGALRRAVVGGQPGTGVEVPAPR
jgi:toxin CptA